MSVRSNSAWSTMIVLSNMDFEEADMRETLSTYKELAKSGMGDMVIVNGANESAYFCTTKMGACYNLPFAYMRNIMNLDNVLEYSEVARWSKPFSMAPLRKALSDGYIEGPTDYAQVINEINSIIQPQEESPHSNSLQQALHHSYHPTSQVVKDLGGEDPKSWNDPFDNTLRRPFESESSG